MGRILPLMLFAICGAIIESVPAKADQDGPKPACQISNPPPNCSAYYAVTVTSLVAGNPVALAGPDPICGEEANPQIVKAALNVATNALGGNIDGAAGDIFNYIYRNNLTGPLIQSVGGTLGDILKRNGPRTDYAHCATISALIQADATWDGGYRLGNVDIDAAPGSGVEKGGCAPGQDCSNGFCRFMTVPGLVKSNGQQAVWTQFANWSDRRRVGSLTVFYKVPQGAPVPHPM